jgi:hypothetical protein
MSNKVEVYRDNAERCAGMAEEAESDEMKLLLLTLSRAWGELARTSEKMEAYRDDAQADNAPDNTPGDAHPNV